MSKSIDDSEKEIIAMLLSNHKEKDLIDEFLFKRCKDMLTYISRCINDNDKYEDIIGEFYMYLSANDWSVIRQYKGEASLYSYLSRCAINYFMAVKKAEEKHCTMMHNEIPDVCDDNDNEEKELQYMALKLAYDSLEKAHKDALDLLVIQRMSALEAADTLWQYTKKRETDWRTLPVKSVQDTIAMSKRRACFSLSQLTHKYLKQLENRGGAVV